MHEGGWQTESAWLTLEDGARLVRTARTALELYLRTGRIEKPGAGGGLPTAGGVFCTLRAHPTGDLLGCMGTLHPEVSLEHSVASAAIWAARDPRLPPLQQEQLSSATLEVSVLSTPESVPVGQREGFPTVIQPGMDGLILRHGARSSLLLPQVWAKLPAPDTFFAMLCFKAGLSRPDAWRDRGASLYRFQVQVFRETAPGGDVVEEHGPWLEDERPLAGP